VHPNDVACLEMMAGEEGLPEWRDVSWRIVCAHTPTRLHLVLGTSVERYREQRSTVPLCPVVATCAHRHGSPASMSTLVHVTPASA
jgi:hypothetical protein